MILSLVACVLSSKMIMLCQPQSLVVYQQLLIKDLYHAKNFFAECIHHVKCRRTVMQNRGLFAFI
jgi:hypothetical protein